jgi:tight adherence protein B
MTAVLVVASAAAFRAALRARRRATALRRLGADADRGLSAGASQRLRTTISSAGIVLAVTRWLTGAERRAANRIDGALPSAMRSVSRSLRSGASVRQAVIEACPAVSQPLRGELERLSDALRGGAALTDVLTSFAEQWPTPSVRLAVAALELGASTGGAASRAVDGVADTLEMRLAVARDIVAQAATARLSAVVIGAAPIVFGAFLVLTDPRAASFFTTPGGAAVLAVAAGLEFAGALWMARITSNSCLP